MTRRRDDEAARRRHAYEHVLRSIRSAYDILIECCHEIEDVELNAGRNTRDLNRILNWVHQISAMIYEREPELEPRPREAPARRWPKDPKRRGQRRDLTREQALYRVLHHLELAELIFQEAVPFARQLNVDGHELDEQIGTIDGIHTAVVQELWKDLSDDRRRAWARHSGVPKGVLEPAEADRHWALGRLNEKLDTAAQVLNECAELVVELELEAQIHLKSHIRSIGECLSAIFDVHSQIYEERPDLIPEFLKDTDKFRHLTPKEGL